MRGAATHSATMAPESDERRNLARGEYLITTVTAKADLQVPSQSLLAET